MCSLCRNWPLRDVASGSSLKELFSARWWKSSWLRPSVSLRVTWCSSSNCWRSSRSRCRSERTSCWYPASTFRFTALDLLCFQWTRFCWNLIVSRKLINVSNPSFLCLKFVQTQAGHRATSQWELRGYCPSLWDALLPNGLLVSTHQPPTGCFFLLALWQR